PLNGVTTFDLVTMRKHILGVQTLDSPYKLIAADINNSRSISTFDMVELRKLILQINSDFSNNTSWRFVRADYNFPEPANPWVEAFPEVINFNNLDVDQTAADFIAIKIGDLNNSAQANALLGTDERTTAGELPFNVADQKVIAGNEYTVEFTAELADVEGYQFTLNYEGLELVNINEGVAKADNFGTVYATEGAITTSWDGVAESDIAFSLTFRATTNARLSELLSVSSQYTTAEAYSNNDKLDVALTFNGATATTKFELFQNTPNPFNGATTVSFNLPEAATATLTVFDLTGKVLSVVNGDYTAGYNEVELANLNASGVLYYSLETANYTATKKMIVIK
ncbi:MAG: T9SS type A sorting domain-containing protein, partial [Saprospiraceae bacterium]